MDKQATIKRLVPALAQNYDGTITRIKLTLVIILFRCIDEFFHFSSTKRQRIVYPTSKRARCQVLYQFYIKASLLCLFRQLFRRCLQVQMISNKIFMIWTLHAISKPSYQPCQLYIRVCLLGTEHNSICVPQRYPSLVFTETPTSYLNYCYNISFDSLPSCTQSIIPSALLSVYPCDNPLLVPTMIPTWHPILKTSFVQSIIPTIIPNIYPLLFPTIWFTVWLYSPSAFPDNMIHWLIYNICVWRMLMLMLMLMWMIENWFMMHIVVKREKRSLTRIFPGQHEIFRSVILLMCTRQDRNKVTISNEK